MEIGLSVILALIALAMVSYPLFRGSSDTDELAGDFLGNSTGPDKEIIMSTLGEIEFDYHMKKLSQEDYLDLKNTYSGAAVEILKSEEQNSLTSDLEAEIEMEIRALSEKEEHDDKATP